MQVRDRFQLPPFPRIATLALDHSCEIRTLTTTYLPTRRFAVTNLHAFGFFAERERERERERDRERQRQRQRERDRQRQRQRELDGSGSSKMQGLICTVTE